MRNLIIIKKICLSALFIALGIVLPMAFHPIKGAGQIMLPMHIPVFISGIALGPVFGLFVGLVTPALSSVLTTMPSLAMMPQMVLELGIYGLTSGLFTRVIKTKWTLLNCYIALIIGMFLGRAMNGFYNGVIMHSDGYNFNEWLTASFVTGLPGIVIQLLVVPSVSYTLDRLHLIDIQNDGILGFPIKKSSKVVKYFDANADKFVFDKEKEEQIKEFLDKFNLKGYQNVLDIGCGTGIIDHHLALNNQKVTAIDISSKMIEEAKKIHNETNLTYLCSDFYKFKSADKFDLIVCFNAYPHFLDKEQFVLVAKDLLKENGRLVIIHNLSKNQVKMKHTSLHKDIARTLEDTKKEAEVFSSFFKINATIDNTECYLIDLEVK